MPLLLSRTLRRMVRSTGRRSVNRAGATVGGAATSISGHFYPYLEAVPIRVVPAAGKPPEISPYDGLSVPPRRTPRRVRERCGRVPHDRPGTSSADDGDRHGIGVLLAPGDRVLDFGCAAGRMLRYFGGVADRNEVWGVDIRAEHIAWCQEHLSPPFRFATTTTHPHLPFEDNSFRFIYACSVFTHIGDLEDTWLLELRRVLRPGGRLFATVHDNHTIELLSSSPPGHWLHDTSLRRQVMHLQARVRHHAARVSGWPRCGSSPVTPRSSTTANSCAIAGDSSSRSRRSTPKATPTRPRS